MIAVRVVAGVLHPQRREDIVLDELLVTAAADFLDDVAKQDVPRIAIAHLLAWKEVERLVANHRDRRRGSRVGELLRLVRRQVREIRDSRRVCEQVENRDPLPRRRRIGQVGLDRVLELQPAALHEQQDRRGRELLGDRPEPELRRRCVRDLPFDVGGPVTLAEEHVRAARDQHRSHEGLVLDVGLDDLVQLGGVLREAGGRDEDEHQSAEQRGQYLHRWIVHEPGPAVTRSAAPRSDPAWTP